MDIMRRLTSFITARRTSWVVLLLAVLGAGLVFAVGSGADGDSSPGVGLPASARLSRWLADAGHLVQPSFRATCGAHHQS